MFELLFKYSRADYARGELVFTGDWPLSLIAGLAVIAAVGIVVMLVRRRRIGALRLIPIGVLQFAVVLVVLAMLEQPALRTETLVPGENVLALVLDTSESMRFGESESRLDTGRQYLTAAADSVAALDTGIRRYELAATATPVPGFGDSVAAGAQTSIAAALQAVLSDARSTSLAAVILSSDGIDTSGGISASQLADIVAFGVPIHTLTVGRERIPEDLELTQVLLPSRALPGSTLSAQVSIRHDAPGSTRVKVYDGDELLLSTPVELAPGATTTSVRVDIERADAGHRQLSFSVDSLPAETELRNNRRKRLVHVDEQPRNILYFEGEPRWEYKFLRRALEADDAMRLVTLLSVSPNKFYRQGLQSPEELEDGFPKAAAELLAYDTLIIGSVEAASFSEQQLDIIRDFVSVRGGSLLLIAGPKGLGNGGWGQSAIADLLPATLPPSATNSFFREKVAVALTPQGADLQMLRLDAAADTNRRSWDGLPDIADYQITGRLKPAALTLVTAATDDGALPLLVTQPYGRGHTYILATGGTWRWQMSLPAEDQRHETFWRQFLRALAASAPPAISVAADARAAKLNVRAEFRDAAFEPVTDLSVAANVAHDEDVSRLVTLTPSPGEPGVYRAEIDAPGTGTWYVEAVAEQDGEPFAVARTSVYVDPGRAEFFNIRADSATLARLAEATGGRQLGVDDIDSLPDLISYSSAGITEAVYRPVWDAPIVLMLLLGLKSAEWLLRRRWGSI